MAYSMIPKNRSFLFCLRECLQPASKILEQVNITCYHSELRRICNALGAEVNNDILQTLDKPSSSVKEKVKENADAQLLKWKQQLTTKQIDDILYMADAVNLTSIYTDATEPNYEYLNTLQRQETTDTVS